MLLLGTLAACAGIGCGAKTGLLVPALERDAAIEAGAVCARPEVTLSPQAAEVLFIIDRSNSMADTLDGRDPGPGELSRWLLLQGALAASLAAFDDRLGVGAEFYPQVLRGEIPPDPDLVCGIDPGIDLPPGPRNSAALLELMARDEPRGGTPTAAALLEAERFFRETPAEGARRFIVLATDGGPNCNADTGTPGTTCLCTSSERNDCLDPIFGPYNCIDDRRTLMTLDALHAGLGIPVYVIGIDNPERPDLAAVLDRMAEQGGVPRSGSSGRRFYSIQRAGDLDTALATITESIARCVFRLALPPTATLLEVRIDGSPIPWRSDHEDGWDRSPIDDREISLYGSACELASAPGARVTALFECAEP
ncbi:MAG: hypothetical protein OEY14_08895 [Myxococcales bacterium]|nr:hypothetical protein [Myxococcales bacterium]